MGGPITWIQAVLLFISITLIFERILFFQSTRLREADLLIGLANHFRKRAYAEARHEASLATGPIGRIMHTIVTRHQLDRLELRGVAEDAVGLEIPKIESNLRAILAIVYLAPLTGMIGTVLGMMDVLTDVSGNGGFATQAQMAEGLFESLTTTVIGLVVAVIGYLSYMYLQSRARYLVNRLDAAAVNLINIIIDARSVSDVVSLEEAKKIVPKSKIEA